MALDERCMSRYQLVVREELSVYRRRDQRDIIGRVMGLHQV